MLSEEVAQVCCVVFWLFCFFDDDPEEILASQPIVVAALSRHRTAQVEWSRSVPCHLPEPTTDGDFLTSGGALEDQRDLLGGRSGQKTFVRSCSVHGISCCLFKRV